MFNIYQFKLQSYCSFKCFMRTGGYGGPVGFLVKKYTCPVIFLGCPGRPGLVFVGPCMEFPHSFLRPHFVGKPVMVSRNVRCFHMLIIIFISFFFFQAIHQQLQEALEEQESLKVQIAEYARQVARVEELLAEKVSLLTLYARALAI